MERETGFEPKIWQEDGWHPKERVPGAGADIGGTIIVGYNEARIRELVKPK